MSKLIGLCGKAGAGKDFVFSVLRETAPDLDPIRVAFADGLKLDIEETLEESLPVIYRKPYKPEVRALLQWWGTDLRRAQNENYWVDKGIERVREMYEHTGLVVVTDVRFANEAEVIRAEGGIVVEVRAIESTRARRLGGVLPPAHASEEIDFEVDAVIENDTDERPPYLPKAVLGYVYDMPFVSR